mmetsp:Transcript_20891/g.43421  ORF Transcript_20891/g.43421 Transcript_20891/m.43421 type:complete len:206 (+) Transcript_20891:94-711(+)
MIDDPIDPPRIPPADPTREMGTHTPPPPPPMPSSSSAEFSSSIQIKMVLSMLELKRHGLSRFLFPIPFSRQLRDVTASSCPSNNASNDIAVVENPEDAACRMVRRASPSSSSRSSMLASSSSLSSMSPPSSSSSTLLSSPMVSSTAVPSTSDEATPILEVNFHRRIFASCPELAKIASSTPTLSFSLWVLGFRKSGSHAKQVIQS